MSERLMQAILAMDVYNRGFHGALLNFNPARIGQAVFTSESSRALGPNADNAGFYATSYRYAGQTIVSYRGTDDFLLDPLTGWPLGAGSAA
jgi:hypothetical protein